MNPPSGSGTASLRHLNVARQILNFEEVQVTNLFSVPTRSVTDIAEVGQHPEGWTWARESLAQSIENADDVLIAWGLGGFGGAARTHCSAQIDWVYQELNNRGIDEVWMVGNPPRHPSRWHQYVSDRHGRTAGGSFDVRLRQVLHRRSTRELVLK